MFTGIGGVSIFNKKGITLIEVLVTIAILSVAIISIFVFNTKIKNKTTNENNMIDVFYNNISAYEIIQKELSLTGDIYKALETAIKETKGYSGRYIKELEVNITPVIIISGRYDPDDPNSVNVYNIDPDVEPVYKSSGTEIDYFKKVTRDKNGEKATVLYYYSNVVSPKFNLSYNIPIYKITINTKLGGRKWDNLAIETLVCQNGGINIYGE